MFIYHFNRMIRNRFLWLIFGIVVAIAFLSVGSCDIDALKSAQSEGTINGEQVSSDEYKNAAEFIRIATRGTDISPMMTETQIWAHIAALRTADKVGISASTDELNTLIKSNPGFQINGQFSKPLFEQAVSQQLGLDPIVYRDIVLRHNVILSKLAATLAAGSVVSPAEVQDAVNSRTDTVTFQSASVNNKFIAQDYETTDEDLKKYYEEHQDSYKVDDRVSASYAVIPVTNYIASVSVPEEDIETYYSNNEEKYTFKDADGNTTNRPLAEVHDEIRTELALVEANFIAETNLASIIAVNLNNAQDDVNEAGSIAARQHAFATWAKVIAKLNVRETGLVSSEDSIYGVDADATEEFRNALHGLSVKPENENIFASVIGERTAYLLCVKTNDDARVLSFDEVKDSVRSALIADRRANDFKAYTDKIAADIKSAMATNDFENAARGLALNVSTSITFSAESPNPSLAQPAILRAALFQPEKVLSDVIETYGGAAFVYVHKRVAADEGKRAEAMQELMSGSSATAMPFAEWLIWNLKNSDVKSYRLINE